MCLKIKKSKVFIGMMIGAESNALKVLTRDREIVDYLKV
jgi:hypothetical protein